MVSCKSYNAEESTTTSAADFKRGTAHLQFTETEPYVLGKLNLHYTNHNNVSITCPRVEYTIAVVDGDSRDCDDRSNHDLTPVLLENFSIAANQHDGKDFSFGELGPGKSYCRGTQQLTHISPDCKVCSSDEIEYEGRCQKADSLRFYGYWPHGVEGANTSASYARKIVVPKGKKIRFHYQYTGGGAERFINIESKRDGRITTKGNYHRGDFSEDVTIESKSHDDVYLVTGFYKICDHGSKCHKVHWTQDTARRDIILGLAGDLLDNGPTGFGSLLNSVDLFKPDLSPPIVKLPKLKTVPNKVVFNTKPCINVFGNDLCFGGEVSVSWEIINTTP